jgi:putative nucleotidyltransferase with HDIG domain
MTQTQRPTALDAHGTGPHQLARLLRTAAPLSGQVPAACVMLGSDQWPAAGGDNLSMVMSAAAQLRTEGGLVLRWSERTVVAILPGLDLLEAWIWADRVRHHARTHRGHDHRLHTVSGGVVAVAAGHLTLELVDLAEAALELAQRDGGDGVCSWDWVEIDAILGGLERRTDLDPLGRHQWLLHDAAYLLGPTQDQHLKRHSDVVRDVAMQLARHLRLPPGEIARVALAGQLHDLGKCVIPEALLAKPASLSIQEWALVARHATIGAEMARRLGVDTEVVRCIAHHHDRYEGMTLRGEAERPPLGARILAVADAIVAMVTPQTYRSPLAVPSVLTELTRESGRQFDPQIVAAVCRADLDRLSAAA